MRIEEAIEILEHNVSLPSSVDPQLLVKAEELGIEALKRYKALRSYPGYMLPLLLPGETKETPDV